MVTQNPLGELRRSQLISTYGPGSLIPVEEASYVVLGLDHWNIDEVRHELREPRLERHLGKAKFMWPPSSDQEANARDIPVARFPKMYSCSSCHALARYRDLAGPDSGLCVHCTGRLVTSRFVVVCEGGHLSDFPYHRWVHSEAPVPEGPGHNLRMRSLGRSAALSDVIIECDCSASRTMEGALSKNALLRLTKCNGDQPWLRSSDPETCDSVPRGMQRGASNVWQAVTASSISIPPWSEEASRFVDRYWTLLANVPEAVRAGVIQATLEGYHHPVELHEVLSVIADRLQLADGPAPSAVDLRSQEYVALRRGRTDNGKRQEFICLPPSQEEQIPEGLKDLRLVTRLREVRALTGFQRRTNSAAEQQTAQLSRRDLSWLPAIEVSGEGIFLTLDPAQLEEWENLDGVRARISRIGALEDPFGRPYPADRLATPRRVLVHTLAHALIDQWSLECGYPAASLRERLYVDDQMAGVLIYTATSDSAGSLGGVVGMARDGKFERTLLAALGRSAWCSNDPLCMESGATGVDARNLGACHACSLLPETSCELDNTLLDRGLLAGDGEQCPGYFAHLIKA